MTTFISYSSTNRPFAMRLAKDLKVAGLDIWFDQLDIPKGARWDDEIEKALHKCSSFLIILSPESVASQNVKDEIGFAIDSGKRILPAMIKECEIPFRLRRFQYVDFTKDDYDERFLEIKDLLLNTTRLQSAKDIEKSPEPAPSKKATEATKKPIPMPALIGGGVGLVVIILAIILMSGKDPATPTVPVETEMPLAATKTPTAEPTDAPVIPTATPAPASAPEPQPFYTENFDTSDMSHWTTFTTSGDKNKLEIGIDNGKMTFDLNDSSSDLYAYAVFNDFTYSDVKMETVANNRGINENNVSLICRYSEGSWYEFNIGNDGFYTIYAYDSVIGYDPLFEGGSNAIHSGTSTNKYTAECKGNKLTLWINDEKVRSIPVTRYNYEKGNIGLSVSSFGQLPVKVEFESLAISEP